MNKACWPQFPSVELYDWDCVKFFSPFFQTCVWPKHTMHPVISLKRRWNAHRNAPQCVCWHSWSRLSDVDKDILLEFNRFTPWRNSASCEAVTWDIATYYIWMEIRGPWGSRWPRDLGAWFRSSNQFLMCFVSTLFPFNYKPFHPAECIMITEWVFFLYSLSSLSGGPWDILVPLLVVRCDSRVHSVRNWLQLVQLCWFSLVSNTKQSFRCAQRHPRETAAKQKLINQQRPWMNGSTADNTEHIP